MRRWLLLRAQNDKNSLEIFIEVKCCFAIICKFKFFGLAKNVLAAPVLIKLWNRKTRHDSISIIEAQF